MHYVSSDADDTAYVDGRADAATHHVWIVNHSASAPHKTGGGGRHYSIAKSLPEFGWSATVFGSTTVHATGKQAFSGCKRVRRFKESGVDCVWVWSNSYASGGAMRFVGMIIFTLSLLIPSTTKKSRQPHAVVGSTVHLLAAWAAYRLARRRAVPFIFEIRDIWPETLIDLGALKEQSLIASVVKRFSIFLARRAALVISPLPGVDSYLIENGIDTPFLWVSNGTEGALDSGPSTKPSQTNSAFTFMYLGSLGRANAVDTLLTAFDRASESLSDIKPVFRLVGSGPLKDQLRRDAGRLKHGDKVTFEERIPRSGVIERAKQADCLVANLRDRSIYRYGISLNKLYDYMLASRPTVIGISAFNDPVKDAAAGISVAADNVDALADAMVRICRMTESERNELGERGRDYVLAHYSYQNLAARLAAALDQLL